MVGVAQILRQDVPGHFDAVTVLVTVNVGAGATTCAVTVLLEYISIMIQCHCSVRSPKQWYILEKQEAEG